MSKVYLRKSTKDCIVAYDDQNKIEATYTNANKFTYFMSRNNQLSIFNVGDIVCCCDCKPFGTNLFFEVIKTDGSILTCEKYDCDENK